MNKTKSFLAIASTLLALTLTFSCSSDDGGGGNENKGDDGPKGARGASGTFTDSRDNKTYKWVEIGSQTWMAENLNYNASGSECYENNTSNCNTYGRLYTWATAMSLSSNCNFASCASQIASKHTGICPSGWHIPSDDDWKQLIHYIDGDDYSSFLAGRYLKSATGWSNCGASGSGSSYQCEDYYGFSALPGGKGFTATPSGMIYDETFFYDVGEEGNWWTSSEYESARSCAHIRDMAYDDDYAGRTYASKSDELSVRCLKGQGSGGGSSSGSGGGSSSTSTNCSNYQSQYDTQKTLLQDAQTRLTKAESDLRDAQATLATNPSSISLQSYVRTSQEIVSRAQDSVANYQSNMSRIRQEASSAGCTVY